MNDSRERIRRERDREKNTYTSPRLALRRVLLLAEGRQYREAAQILSRLGPGILQCVATELPLDIIVDSLPHSSHLLETLFGRLSSLDMSPKPEIQCEMIAWRLVGLFGSCREQPVTLKAKTGQLAQELISWKPDIRNALENRRRELDKAVQGLGTHGLTADASGTLISLHIALKNELLKHIEVYKQAVHKLEELSNITLNQDPANSSHQRLLALSHSDIERRLIDNKSLLTIIDKPALRQLPSLIESLDARVQCDKDVLSCVGQIKRIDSNIELTDSRPVAGLLMSYSRGCDAVLSMMSDVRNTSVSPLPRSPGGSSTCSDGYHSDSDNAVDGDDYIRRNGLITRYGALFAKAVEETVPALGELEPLQHAHQLKYKIIFSVVVLSYRAVVNLRERRLCEVRSALGVDVDTVPSDVQRALDNASRDVLAHTVDSFPLGEAERVVANQVLGTLREYPCLSTCASLHALISTACRVAWLHQNARPSLDIDTDFTPVLMRSEKHVRFITSDQRSDLIRSFIWPALMDNNKCVYRAVVMT